MKILINKVEQVELDPVCSNVSLRGNKVLTSNASSLNTKMLVFSNSDNAKDAFCAIMFAFDKESSSLEITESKDSIRFKC